MFPKIITPKTKRMKKPFQLIHSIAIVAASVLTASLASAQSIWTNSSGNWSVATNWKPNGVPGAATNVLFTNNVGSATSAGAVDNSVDTGFAGTIAALQYANTNTSNGSGYYHTTQIASGQTLTVSNGLTVGTLTDAGGNTVVNATITGTGGTMAVSGGLVVNQASATSGTHFGFLNMSNLDTFIVNNGRLQIGIANGVNRAEGILYLARTNTISLSGSAPQFYMGFNNGNNDGSAEFPILYLGQTNAFFVDSITMSADKQGNPASRVLFNPVFTSNNPTAYFRGTNGSNSRVTTWILGNNAGQSTTSSSSDCTNDYSFGTLDAMVNSMTLGISEKAGATGSGSGNGTFTFTAGTLNVNNLYLGYGLGNTGTSVGNGTMNVNDTATLIANNGICLSYWTSPSTSYGAGNLNISGGTVLANTITNGTTAPGSAGYVNADLTVNGGTLGITSLVGSIGSAAAPLGIVTFNNAMLQLPVSGLQPAVAAVSVNLGGTTNMVGITFIPASVISYPSQIPLITYGAGGGALGGAFNIGLTNLPGAYQGYLSNNVANNSIDLVLTSGPTSVSVLEWNGAASASWDTTSANWLIGSSPVVYTNGDGVLFDDNATGPTAVNIVAAVPPASMTVSNNVDNYSFSGSGIGGGGSLTKDGSGTLLFTNSGNTFFGGITINAGTVQFGNGGTSGNLPAIGDVVDNGSLVIDHSDNFTVPNSISGTGTLAQTGSDVVTLTASNSFSGTTVANAGTLLVDGVLSGSLTSAAGTTIGGSGTNSGPVNVGGAIQPSAVSGTPSTFTSGDLNLSTGATLTFDLNGTDNTIGSGSNDLLQVNGNFNANNNVVSLNFAGVPQTGVPYTLINYSGTTSGSLNSTAGGTHYAATINQAGSPVTVTLSGSGANLKWDSTSSAVWDVGRTSNWLNQASSLPDVFYSGDNVLFDDSVAGVVTNVTIGTGVAVYPALITVTSTNKYFTIGGNGKISGQASIQKYGPSTLTLSSGANDFTNTIQVFGGLLKSGVNGALGKGIAYVYPGATLDLNATAPGCSVGVAGTGIGGAGAIVNNGFILNGDQGAFGAGTYVYVESNSVFGCNNRWDIRNGNLFSGDGNPWNIAIKGSNGVYLVNATVDDHLGSVDIQSGIFAIQTTTLANSTAWAGNPAHMITVESNAMLELDLSSATAGLGQSLVFSNNSVLQNDGTVCSVNGTVALQGNTTLNNSSSATMELDGIISGPGSLTKLGIGSLTLTAANTYTGSTLLNVGTLLLSGSGSISDSPNILIAANAVLDTSLRTDQTLTMALGQTLQGNGAVNGLLNVEAGATMSPGTNLNSIGALTISNAVTLDGTTLLKLNATAKTNDVLLVVSNGIAFGGTLTVTNLSGTLTSGQSFQLFVATNYTGAFGATNLPALGAGLVWDTSLLGSQGVITVASAPAPTQPYITSINVSGSNLIIVGTNGSTTYQSVLLTTTNLALALKNWTPVVTNTFSSGNFSITNPVNSGSPQNFYILRTP
jgi:fibronectin-binding autotransporter adhesin